MTTTPTPLAAPASPPHASAHVCLLYTLLRHGRGLSHEEATRRIDDTIGAALGRVPAQAC